MPDHIHGIIYINADYYINVGIGRDQSLLLIPLRLSGQVIIAPTEPSLKEALDTANKPLDK
jgi:hypothetical protein